MQRRTLLSLLGAAALALIIVMVIVTNVSRVSHQATPNSAGQAGIASDGNNPVTPTATPTHSVGPAPENTPSAPAPVKTGTPANERDAAPQGAPQTSQDTADQTAAEAAALAFVKGWVGYDDTTPAAVAQRINTIKTLEAPGAGLDATHSRLANSYPSDGYPNHKVTIGYVSSVFPGGQTNGHWVIYVTASYVSDAIMPGHTAQVTGEGMWTVELPAHSGNPQPVYAVTESLTNYTQDDPES